MAAVILHPDPGSFKALPALLPEVQVQKSMATDTLPQVLIRWGVEEGRDQEISVVLNRVAALKNVPRARAIWEECNIPVGVPGAAYYRRYRYYLFDLLPVRVLRKEIGHKNVTEISINGSKEARDGAALSTRALHALRLDFGLVEVGVDSRGRIRVLSVNPSPRMTTRLAQSFAERIRQRIREAELRQTLPIFQKANPAYLDKIVSIGADPEFMLLDGRTRRIVMASRFFPKDGPVGCDSRYIRGMISGYPLAELRPEPSYSPLQLVENIRTTMKKALRLAPYTNVQWRAGSMPFSSFPIGGHVHFKGVLLSGQLMRALDNYLAAVLTLIEEPHTAKKRRAKYGYLGDFRLKGHGGFEYRTPASWLVSPEVTRATLCLAKVIASEYHVLSRDVFINPEAQYAFMTANREYFAPYFQVLWNELAATTTYKLYAHDLQVLEDMISNRQTWVERVDIRRTWGLPIPKGKVYRP